MRRRILLLIASLTVLLSAFFASPSAQAISECDCAYCAERPYTPCASEEEGYVPCIYFSETYCPS